MHYMDMVYDTLPAQGEDAKKCNATAPRFYFFMPILRLLAAPALPKPFFLAFLSASSTPGTSSSSSAESSSVFAADSSGEVAVLPLSFAVPLAFLPDSLSCLLSWDTLFLLLLLLRDAGVGVSSGPSSVGASTSPVAFCEASNGRRDAGSLSCTDGGSRAAPLRRSESVSATGHVRAMEGLAAALERGTSPSSPA